MPRSETVETAVPMLVLVKAKMPDGRVPRWCLKLVECDISIPVIDAASAPVAYRIPLADKIPNNGIFAYESIFYTRHGTAFDNDRQDIRNDGERLLLDVGLSAKEMIAGMKKNPLFRVGQSGRHRNALRHEVVSKGPKGTLPEGLHRYFNMTFVNISPQALPGLLKLTKEAVPTDEGLAQIEEAKAAFRASLSDIVFVGDRCHVECGEPVYLHQKGASYADKVRIADSSYWPGPSRPAKYHDAACRFYPPDTEEWGDGPRRLPDQSRIDVVANAVPALRIDECEFDRIARALSADIGRWLCEEERLLSAPRGHVEKWMALRDFLTTYDPLTEGVPEETEVLFEEAAAVHAAIGGTGHVSKGDLDYARTMWADRPIDDLRPAVSRPRP